MTLHETAHSYLTDDEFINMFQDAENLSDIAMEGMRRLRRSNEAYSELEDEVREIKEWMERMPDVN